VVTAVPVPVDVADELAVRVAVLETLEVPVEVMELVWL